MVTGARRNNCPTISTLNKWAEVLRGLDLTEIFKDKGEGNIKRWSAKRTIGGVIATTACMDVANNGVTWPAVVMCAVAVVPLCISVFEKP